MEIIKVDEKYRNLCQILLKDVYLIDAESEIDIDANLPDDNMVLLQKEGKYSKNKLGISGGSVGLFEGKRIGRAKNLEILEKEIKDLNEQIDIIQETQEELNGRLIGLKGSSQKDFIDEQRLQLNRLNNELTTVKTKQEQYQTFINSSQNRKQDIETKVANIIAQLEKSEPE